MKQINTEILKALKPCSDRYEVWLKHYKKFDGSLLDFLELDKISAKDKIWVSVRVMPRFLVEVFAIDCAFRADAADAHAARAVASASDDSANYSAGAAASSAAYAAAAADNSAYAAERENQIDALIMLIKSGAEVNNMNNEIEKPHVCAPSSSSTAGGDYVLLTDKDGHVVCANCANKLVAAWSVIL